MDSLAGIVKLAVQQALRNHQSQLSSSTGPSVQSTGFEGQEPRSCAVDATLGLIEGQEPEIPGIPANIIIIDQPEYKTRNFCSTAQDQPTTSLLPFPSMNLSHIRLVKIKIWADEYVELPQLLKPFDWGQYNMSMSIGGVAPALFIQSKQRTKNSGIDQWCSVLQCCYG